MKKIILAIITITNISFASDITALRPIINNAAKEHNVSPIMLEAIIRHESNHGKSNAAKVKNNLAGIMGRKGLKRFNSKEECINTLAKIISKYKQSGRTSVTMIGKKYASDKNWSKQVQKHINAIKAGKHREIDGDL